MNEFDDDPDAELNALLNIPYVVFGLCLFVAGLFTLALSETMWIKYVAATAWFSAIFIMTRRERKQFT